jgi:uncharacterized membrane protein HdeD (DUF308 family)
MSVTASATFPRASVGWSIVLSVFLIVAGILAIVMPLAAAIAVNIFVAWMLMFSGAAHLVFAWQRRHSRGFIWQLLLGILYAFIGAYILINPALGLVSLALAIAAYLLIEGVLEIILALQIQPTRAWGWLLFDGILTLILALMIWKAWPAGSELVVAILVGISMLFSGISRLMLSLAARHLTA